MMAFLAWIALGTSSVFALSNDDHARYLKESPAYAEAEKELNAVWKKVKGLPEDDFKKIQAEQRKWLKQRDEYFKKAKAGGDGRPASEIYAENTRNRVKALTSLLSKKDSKSGSGESAEEAERRLREIESEISSHAQTYPPLAASMKDLAVTKNHLSPELARKIANNDKEWHMSGRRQDARHYMMKGCSIPVSYDLATRRRILELELLMYPGLKEYDLYARRNDPVYCKKLGDMKPGEEDEGPERGFVIVLYNDERGRPFYESYFKDSQKIYNVFYYPSGARSILFEPDDPKSEDAFLLDKAYGFDDAYDPGYIQPLEAEKRSHLKIKRCASSNGIKDDSVEICRDQNGNLFNGYFKGASFLGVEIEAVYQDGRKHGVSTIYNDGETRVVKFYDNGKLSFKDIYLDGGVIARFDYHDGKESDTYTQVDQNGRMTHRIKDLGNGRQLVEEYDQNGVKRLVTEEVDGKAEGRRDYYDQNGRFVGSGTCSGGVCSE